MLEVLEPIEKSRLQAVVFDFDGTLSTIRHGWEDVMRPFMLEQISPHSKNFSSDLIQKVNTYIADSTGTQTIYQMQWLAEMIKEYGENTQTHDIWWYKEEYNRRLMEQVEKRLEQLRTGEKTPDDFLIQGSIPLLDALRAQGIRLFVASGTDEVDVKKEAQQLGIASYFDQIAGAPHRSMDCSKEAILKKLLQEYGRQAGLLVIGDGPIEIALAREFHATVIGAATNETDRQGIDPVKRERLVRAGAQAIVGDYKNTSALLNLVHIPPIQQPVCFKKIRTWSALDRTNLVTIDTLQRLDDPVPEWNDPNLDILVEKILQARKNKHPVIWFQGAHVIKNGLSRYLIDLIDRGLITAIAGNGACSIHDFELGYLGGTSEDVATSIEDGSFGMWEETGRWMNEALQAGARKNLGYGESLAMYIEKNPERFPHRKDCLLYRAWKKKVLCTYHIALGTDIIHQHPIVDFGAIGQTSGTDFRMFCGAITQLDQGVFLNFGSGVIGPEVFLKALSIARNLGYPTFRITTANFDLKDLGDFRSKISYSDPDYYYRPRKNIVNRPTSMGGWGHHFSVDHQISIPTLYHKLLKGAREHGL